MIIPAPHIEQTDTNNNEYCLVDDYSCVLPNGYSLTIKEGFVFDGASIPRLFWTLVGSPFTGSYARAALIHDALYQSEILSRKECDDIFYDVMYACGSNWITRYTLWAAVRTFGGFVWSNHKDFEVSKAYSQVFLET